MQSYAQNGNSIFNESIIHTVKLSIDYDNWFDTLSNDYTLNLQNPELYPEIYRKCNIIIDGQSISKCGIRQRGNFTNIITVYGRKKPMKISFDNFIDQSFDGIKKLNLNNFTNDPSLLHEAISYKIFRDNGIPTCRTSFAKVFVNDEYLGIYLLVENIDKTFLKNEYGSANNDGNLYKTDREAKVYLNYLGNDKQAYKNQGLKLTTNENIADYINIIHFIDFLNNYKKNNFKDSLETVFEVHSYLKILAIEKFIKSWDSYWGGGNNFYLYEHPDKKIRWLPWDLNETFQDVKSLNSTNLIDGYLVPTNKFDERPLLKRILEIEEYQKEYLDFCCELKNSTFSINHLGNYIYSMHNLIYNEYQNDPNKLNTFEAFEKSLTQWNEDEVNLFTTGLSLKINYPGIYPFIAEQSSWVTSQLDGWNYTCKNVANTYNLFIFPNPAIDYIKIPIDSLNFQYSQIKIFDVNGSVVQNNDFDIYPYKIIQLDICCIPNGLYVVIKNDCNGQKGIGKFIKQ